MTKIYGLYRMRYSQLRDRQSMSFYLEKDLSEYFQAGVVTLKDMELSDEQYTLEVVPGLKNNARFFVAEYVEQYVQQQWVNMLKARMVNNHYAEFFDTPEAAATWLSNSTNLVETEPATFKIADEVTEVGFESPAKFITID